MVLWVGVLYLPLTLLLARPLAVVLGLVEREARPAPASAGGGAEPADPEAAAT
jgi:hypothetical protein